MISSRCRDSFPLTGPLREDLSTIRLRLKNEIERSVILGENAYDVWINEVAAEDATEDAWDECLRQARECDIFIALYNGNAGWPGMGANAGLGICHAEFQTAYAQAPAKVFLINIFEPGPKAPSADPDLLFQSRIQRENRFGASAKTVDALERAVRRTIVTATVRLTQRGVADGGRGRGSLGPALDWSRLGYDGRRSAMIAVLKDSLKSSKDRTKEADRCIAEIGGSRIFMRLGAVPDAMSVPAARELVGQPHLTDHSSNALLTKVDGGPVHVIACMGGVTAAQAQRMLGFSNATFIAAGYGIYAVDPVQGVQIVLIANCVEEDATRHGVQRFLEWLPQSEQAPLFVRHAAKRRRIVELLATNV